MNNITLEVNTVSITR